MKFQELHISDKLKEGIESFNYSELTEIQEKAIPEILKSKDLLACSQTGSGKTAAFLIPIIERILSIKTSGIKALIITPTREICKQIEEQIVGLGYYTDTSYVAVYGGNDHDGFSRQKTALTEGADIVVATPGRLISHLALGYVNISNLDFLILDEADEMLDMGFYEDILNIIGKLPKKRQTLMFSATMPHSIRKLAKEILTEPYILDLNFSKPAEEIDQQVYMVYEKDKPAMLANVLKEHKDDKVLVFTSTKVSVGKISAYLRNAGIKNSSINSSFTQTERNDTILDFKSRKIRILVATNLLSRGIDIDDVNLIVNYEIPDKAEDYVHRIGRTARAGKLGLAVSFIGEKEILNFNRIEKLLEKDIEKLSNPEGISQGPTYRQITTGKKNYHKKRFSNKPRKGNNNKTAK
ncbi:MAG: DEAD/DEAH box helicase [Bacteroidales bacterium]|nr:DEAD/DEAH box helicase [Bacteroidales bacterium]